MVTFFVLLSLCSGETQPGNCTQIDKSNRPDCPSAIAFFDRLQIALKNDDRRELASIVNYPLLTTLNHKKTHIRSREELLSHFDELFDAGVRCAILNSKRKEVWGNWRGFMIGRGAVWFDGIIPPGESPDIQSPDYWKKYPFRIITINNGYGEEYCKK
jgi:hypothetical protein